MNKIIWTNVLNKMADLVIENEQLLCDLDAYVGDGDHGLTVARGFKNVKEYLKVENDKSIYELTNDCANILGKSLGGAIGPIFQSIFSGFALAVNGKDEIDIKCLADMFSKALSRAMLIGGAKEGDKTLIDTIAPVSRVLKELSLNNSTLENAAKIASEVAFNSCKETTNMIAKKGRAKFLGEKSLGHQDAGATTMYFVIKAIDETINEK